MTEKDDVEGRARGGLARAEALPVERRKAIAKQAAVARWGARATHTGNFMQDFGIDVDCYVLDDPQKTAVISQSGMAKALGLSTRGNAFPRFLASKGMSRAVGADVRAKAEKPIKFQWGTGGAEQPPTTINGYDVSLLIDVCKAIAEANLRGELAKNQQGVARQASVIMTASAKSGIKQLVYALAGYNPTVEEVIHAFRAYIQEEARKYEPEFPNELYVEWHRLYKIPVPVRGRPWHFKHLTVRHIYHPLAQSRGNLLKLLRALRENDGARQKKLFQFLNEIGARALRIHLGRVLEMAQSATSQDEYERKISTRFGDQKELELVLPSDAPAAVAVTETLPP